MGAVGQSGQNLDRNSILRLDGAGCFEIDRIWPFSLITNKLGVLQHRVRES